MIRSRMFFMLYILLKIVDTKNNKLTKRDTMKNNKNRMKDRDKSNPELRKMKPRDNADAGIVAGKKTEVHDGGHEKYK